MDYLLSALFEKDSKGFVTAACPGKLPASLVMYANTVDDLKTRQIMPITFV